MASRRRPAQRNAQINPLLASIFGRTDVAIFSPNRVKHQMFKPRNPHSYRPVSEMFIAGQTMAHIHG